MMNPDIFTVMTNAQIASALTAIALLLAIYVYIQVTKFSKKK